MAKIDAGREQGLAAGSTGRRLSDAEILAQIPAARARATEQAAVGFRASSARYSVATKSLVVTLSNGTTLGIPVAGIEALSGAAAGSLATVAVSPTGSALHWERLDVDLSVAALVREALGGPALRRLFAAEGGRSKSEPKTLAARLNGAKGGRPRKNAGPAVRATPHVASAPAAKKSGRQVAAARSGVIAAKSGGRVPRPRA